MWMKYYLKTDKSVADQNLYKLETRKKVKKKVSYSGNSYF